MTMPTFRTAAWSAAAVLAAAAACLLLARGGDPDIVWLRADAAAVGDFRLAPDGEEVPHAATMQDPSGGWAYYYPLPSRVRDALHDLGLGPGLTVDFLATGRETPTASGLWREYRRCRSEELTAEIPRRAAGPSARR
jgi:hypothetical protein